MRRINSLTFTPWRSLFALFTAACIVSPALAGVAEIVSLTGKSEYRGQSESSWREAKLKQALDAGCFVRTGDLSTIALLFADKTQMRLSQNGLFQVKGIDPKSGDATVSLRQGRAWMQAKSLPGSLKMETPSAIAAIHGTDWEMEVDEEGRARLIVLHGVVELYNSHGSVTVSNNEQAIAEIGKAPVKLLLQNPAERVQWVTSYTVNADRYRELNAIALAGAGEETTALREIAALIRSQNMAEARKRLRERVQSPQLASSVAFLLLADFAIYSGDLRQAEEILKQGKERFSADPRLDAQLARVALYRDDAPTARQILQAAVAHHPDAIELKLAQGEIARFDGEAREASAAYRAATILAPQDARGWHGLGVVDSEKEDIKQARPSLIKALELDDKAPTTRGELATLETFANNLDTARSHYDLALQAHPDDYVALTGLGLLQLKSGDTEQALETLLKASVIEPKYARAVVYTAVAYYQLGRHRVALETLSRAGELDRLDPLPHQLASQIHTDLLEPGLALDEAREAMRLLPYLKSLNQLANDQKGAANLGNALAQFGLEDWALNYAQQSYNPYWAGSHLFLADRYSGDFNKKSELFQGFLADPTVFGASNRFSTLIPRPGAYADIGGRYDFSRDFKLSEPTVTVNGYNNGFFPVAYFVETIRTETQPDRVAFDAGANTYTLALGARPTHELGLFAYANAFDADIMLHPLNSIEQRVSGHNERFDLGAHYHFGPESQAWIKIGQGTESSTVNQLTTAATIYGQAANASVFQTNPEQNDIQFRHTFAANDQHELSWGAEHGRLDKTNTLVQENFYHIGTGVVPSDRLVENDRDLSRDLWLSDRFRVSERLTLQGDLAWQHYTKERDIKIDRDRVPPVTQTFPESYDRSLLAPRLGAAYVLGGGAILRGAWQKWLRPASYSSLTPVATAGIPIDDTLNQPGGTITRSRIQLDWEISPAGFVTAFADRRNVDNLNSPLDGVLNTRADVTNLDRLRQQSVVNLAAPDRLEATPIFSQGTATSGGFSLNHVLSRHFAGYLGYTATQSENTGADYKGKAIPYLPKHRANIGLTWAGEQHITLGAQAVWRSERFSDEANRAPMAPGWELALKLRWESADKRWNVETYAANLLKHDIEDILGVNLMLKF